MNTIEYNSLDSEQFESFQSIPEKKKSIRKILWAIALIGIAAYVGYLLGKRRRDFNMKVGNKGSEDAKHLNQN